MEQAKPGDFVYIEHSETKRDEELAKPQNTQRIDRSIMVYASHQVHPAKHHIDISFIEVHGIGEKFTDTDMPERVSLEHMFNICGENIIPADAVKVGGIYLLNDFLRDRKLAVDEKIAQEYCQVLSRMKQ